MTSRQAHKAVVGGQKHIDAGIPGASEMQGIQWPKPNSFQFILPRSFALRYEDQALRKTHQEPKTNSPHRIRSPFDFEDHCFAGDPLPGACLHMSENGQYGRRFEADAILRLIVEGPVQAADVEVDSPHTDFLCSS